MKEDTGLREGANIKIYNILMTVPACVLFSCFQQSRFVCVCACVRACVRVSEKSEKVQCGELKSLIIIIIMTIIIIQLFYVRFLQIGK